MLLTKLHIPASGKNLIQRPGLLEKLNHGLDRKLILISAPAGFGKSTALVEWIKQYKIPTAWFSIDNRDNDPVEFLRTVIAGIQTINKDTGSTSLELLNSEHSSNRSYIVELLINDMLKMGKDFLLVLDDFHLIESRAITEIISFLIEHIPEQCHIAISTRSDPALPIARLRSRDELVEIRSADLIFSATEINQLFNKKLKLRISTEDILLLESKTEGWIAGLQLTALSIRGKENASEFIQDLVGDHRYIMDYLMEEVLNSQNEDTRNFLLQSSILEQICGPLCDQVLDRSDSQIILESLEQDNMFIIPLDDKRNWFRYHHLFADLLKQRLNTESKALVKDLHNRASIWFEENELSTLAIEHALEAENYTRAMQLIDVIGIDDIQWDIAQYSSILKFGSLFPDETILSNKQFCIFYSWMLSLYGKIEEAEKYLVQLEEIMLKESNDADDDHQSMLGKLYIVIHFMYTYAGNTSLAFKYSRLALENIGDADSKWKAWAYIAHGESCILRFEISKASESFARALNISEKSNSLYLRFVATSKLAYTLKLEGNYKEAFKLCNELLKSLQDETSIVRTSMEIHTAILHALVGFILIEWNMPEQGLEHALRGYKLSKKASNVSLMGNVSLLLADSHGKLGDNMKSMKVLDELGQKNNMPLLLGVQTQLSKIKTHLKNNEPDEVIAILGKWEHKHDIADSFEILFLNLAKVRYHINQFEMKEALVLLNDLALTAEQKQANELLIEVELLKAKAFNSLDEKSKAHHALARALQLAKSGGNVRTFISEGEDIEELLKELQGNSKSREYVIKLLAAFKNEIQKKNSRDVLLSSRELETLVLMTEDLSNQELADKLFISLNTVKTRLKNIYLKLDVDGRRKAVDKAKSMGLI